MSPGPFPANTVPLASSGLRGVTFYPKRWPNFVARACRASWALAYLGPFGEVARGEHDGLHDGREIWSRLRHELLTRKRTSEGSEWCS